MLIVFIYKYMTSLVTFYCKAIPYSKLSVEKSYAYWVRLELRLNKSNDCPAHNRDDQPDHGIENSILGRLRTPRVSA